MSNIYTLEKEEKKIQIKRNLNRIDYHILSLCLCQKKKKH